MTPAEALAAFDRLIQRLDILELSADPGPVFVPARPTDEAIDTLRRLLETGARVEAMPPGGIGLSRCPYDVHEPWWRVQGGQGPTPLAALRAARIGEAESIPPHLRPEGA